MQTRGVQDLVLGLAVGGQPLSPRSWCGWRVALDPDLAWVDEVTPGTPEQSQGGL